MQVGGATVSVGAGTAILTLPDVPSIVTLRQFAVPNIFIRDFKASKDFEDEVGLNINASIAVPTSANQAFSLDGFWANIDGDSSFTCSPTAVQACNIWPIFDSSPTAVEIRGLGNGVTSNVEREVDQWGVSLESQWTMNPGVMGVTRAPHRRYFAVGADIRGIDQDLDILMTSSGAGITGVATYSEDLDTRYYGAYAAWGGDYSPLLLKGLWSRWGLQSSFRFQGGIYNSQTDYDGNLVDNIAAGAGATSALSLSNDEISFIGGLKLETRKRIGRRATLSLKSEYEYYSYVPKMIYNQVDQTGAFGLLGPGGQVGTFIRDDSAFSARTSLRLTIKLGPSEIMEPSK